MSKLIPELNSTVVKGKKRITVKENSKIQKIFYAKLINLSYFTLKSYYNIQYSCLTSHDSFTLEEAEDLLWHRQVPLKVSILAWRLLRDRLPTKTNLVSRGILAPDIHGCVAGCGGTETARHLFLSCSTFGSLWPLVRSWIGFSAVDAYSLTDHFIQFTYSAGGLRARRSFLQLVWLACVWVVWNERNLRVFRNSENTMHQLLDKVKLFSYRWLRTTDVTLATNFHRWWSNSLLCLGID
jgi:hypothetical protein